MYTWFWWGDLRERKHSEGLDIDGRTILKCSFKEWHRADLSQDRDRWRKLVNTVINFRFPYGEFFDAEKTLLRAVIHRVMEPTFSTIWHPAS